MVLKKRKYQYEISHEALLALGSKVVSPLLYIYDVLDE